MGTNIRAEISQKSVYYISQHRYYELKHFCMQYPEWKHELSSIDGVYSRSAGTIEFVDAGKTGDPTSIYAEARIFYERRMKMVDDAAVRATDDIFGPVLVQAIMEGWSYEQVAARGLTN